MKKGKTKTRQDMVQTCTGNTDKHIRYLYVSVFPSISNSISVCVGRMTTVHIWSSETIPVNDLHSYFV